MGVTVLACYGIERVEQRGETTQLRERAGAIASALERRAAANASYLRAGAALFATLDDDPASPFPPLRQRVAARYGFPRRQRDRLGPAGGPDANGLGFDELVATEYGEDVRLRPAIEPGPALTRCR